MAALRSNWILFGSATLYVLCACTAGTTKTDAAATSPRPVRTTTAPAPITAPAAAHPTVGELVRMLKVSEASYDECLGPPRPVPQRQEEPPGQSVEEALRQYEEAKKRAEEALKAAEHERLCWAEFEKVVLPKLKQAGARDVDIETAMSEWVDDWNDRRAALEPPTS